MDQDVELQEELSGIVTAVLYSNVENGYTVLRLRDSDDQQQTVVGCFPYMAPGESIIATGTWVTHATYGKQFKAGYAIRMLPTTTDEIYAYLAGGAVKGIGAATASLIVNTFEGRSLDILENHPEKLAEIRGISLSRAKEFSEFYRQQAGMRHLIDFVCSYGVRPIIAVRLYRFYAEHALETLHTDPYIIASNHIGGTFSEADTMALQLGFATDSLERVRAAIRFELVHNLNNGHCFIPEPDLLQASCRLIEVEEEAAMHGMDDLVESGQIIRENMRGKNICYLPELYEAETYVASRLVSMSRRPVSGSTDVTALIQKIERSEGIAYASAQKEAMEYALANRLLIITGGPGTGKTSCIRAILELFDAMGVKAFLTAPTGRAAKRLSELSGREASTVHRLLGAKYDDTGEKVLFSKNERDPLDCNAVVLDESSMVDLLLLAALLRAMPENARLIMVGDIDQLPPVGPGNVFRSIIESKTFPTVRFTEIFRQSGESLIVRNAHLINEGIHPDFSANTADFFRLKRLEAASSVETITELCAVRLPNRMHIPPEDIQVLSPTRKGELGTINLNRSLQQALNPARQDKAEKLYGDTVFRVGDRVMQVRNNYDIIWQTVDGKTSGTGIYNGDIGYIRKLDAVNESLEIDFDGKLALYSFTNLNELDHAWAVTVHKAQGCEFRAVVFALSASSRMLMTRSVLYTGITRAKELLILVGDENVAFRMIDNQRRDPRFTFLKTRILAAAGGSEGNIRP